MNVLFLFIMSFFCGAYSMRLPTEQSYKYPLGEISVLPPQLIEQIPLYIADVSKDADEAVQSLIKLGRVNKYCNDLIKKYFTESEEEFSQHMTLYNKLFNQEKWQYINLKPPVFVLFGMKAIDRTKKGMNVEENIIWHALSQAWFEYAVHANKADMMLKCPQPLSSSLCMYYRKRTPLLQVAIENNNPVVVRRLLDLQFNPRVGVTVIGAHGPEFMNLLTFAKQKGNQEIITMLDEALNPTKSIEVRLSEISLR